jgi:hypothetical protein
MASPFPIGRFSLQALAIGWTRLGGVPTNGIPKEAAL